MTSLNLRKTLFLIYRLKYGVMGFAILLVIIFTALLSPWLMPHDPFKQDTPKSLLPPSWMEGGSSEHFLGTDKLGRDLFSRIIYGTRISLIVGFSTVAISVIIGVVLGLIGGYYGGKIDPVVRVSIDTMLSFPFILLAMSVIVVLGPSFENLIICLGITTWPRFAIVVRGEALSLKERGFVMAAKAAGVRNLRIMFRHILPNTLNAIIIIATVEIAQNILRESFLSFLGLGVQPPIPSWGGMLSEGRHLLMSMWWLATFPGLAIFITTLAINMTGDGLRDLFDPYKTI